MALVSVTPAQLRERYRAGYDDEFARLSDTDLSQCVTRALDTSATYLPAGELSDTAEQAVVNAVLIIARAYAHEDRTYSEEHIVMREYQRIMQWLRDVGTGRQSLPGAGETGAGSTTVVVSREQRFTSDVLAKMNPLG